MGINIYRIYNAEEALPENTEPPRWSVNLSKCIVEFVFFPTDGLPVLTQEEAVMMMATDEWNPPTDEFGDEITE